MQTPVDIILPRYIKRSKRSDGAQLKFRNAAKSCAGRKIEAGEYGDRKAGIAFARIQRANIPMQFAWLPLPFSWLRSERSVRIFSLWISGSPPEKSATVAAYSCPSETWVNAFLSVESDFTTFARQTSSRVCGNRRRILPKTPCTSFSTFRSCHTANRSGNASALITSVPFSVLCSRKANLFHGDYASARGGIAQASSLAIKEYRISRGTRERACIVFIFAVGIIDASTACHSVTRNLRYACRFMQITATV